MLCLCSEVDYAVTIDNVDDMYNITVQAVVDPFTLDGDATIECHLSIPYTNLTIQEQVRLLEGQRGCLI